MSVAIDLKAMYESGVPEARRDAQVLSDLQDLQAELGELQVEVAKLGIRAGSASSSRHLATLSDDTDVVRATSWGTPTLRGCYELEQDSKARALGEIVWAL